MKSASRLIAVMFLFLSACSGGEELVSSLDVQQAIEIVVALKKAGIQAEMEKSAARGSDYTVTVSGSDRSNALRLLNEYHLPRKESASFEKLTSSDGFVPNLREISQLRFDRALGVEIERALSGLDGIVEVRAIVRSNLVKDTAIEANGDQPASTATVMIRYESKSGVQPFSVDDVKETIARAVPGLPVANVNVTATRVFVSASDAGNAAGMDAKGNIIPLAAVKPFSFLVPAADQTRVRSIISALLGGFALTGMLVGWSFARVRKPKGPPPKAVRTAMLEASFRGPEGENTPQPPARRAGGNVPKGN